MFKVTITEEGKRAVQSALLQVLRLPECMQAQTDSEYLQGWVDQATENADKSQDGQPFLLIPEHLRQHPDIKRFELKSDWNPPLFIISAVGD
jgi:hypothetical protein